MLLRELQGMLAGLYDAPAEHDVRDFLITDAAHVAALQGAAGALPTDEQLLVAEDEDGLELSLYVDQAARCSCCWRSAAENFRVSCSSGCSTVPRSCRR